MATTTMGTRFEDSPPEVPIPELLDIVIERGASDLHLTAGSPPVVRLHGDLQVLTEYQPIVPRALRAMIYAILPQRRREQLEQDLELDMSYSLPGKARFRVNVYFQRDAIGAAFRLIPTEIRSIEWLGLPPIVAELARYPRGFVVVTGPTGSGKSTTLASLVDIVNQERKCHIMTVEDPIEFLHQHKTALVNQREVGTDTHGFAQALKHVLRQDPDVILVGEMRDLETIQTAITAAETGHLVFATLHTQDAPQTIDRIIDVFPSHQQQQIRIQLSTTLQAVLTQQLLQTVDGQGRVVAAEVLIATPAVRNLIREGKVHQIYSAMQAGGRVGMQTMDAALAQLVRSVKVTQQLALEGAGSSQEASMASVYTYRVRDRQGKLVTGSLQADSERLVISRLQEMGYVPVQVSEKKVGIGSREISFRPGHVKLKDLAVFSRQFATMVNSGLPILKALTILSQQTESKALTAAVTEVRLDVERGSALSVAMAKRPKAFNNLYVAMVRSGETGGVLDSVLLRIADNIENEVELRQRIKSAMTYPVVVLAMVGLILVAMLLFIVPQFKSIYAELHGTLPLPTRILLAVSDVFRTWWWAWALALAAGLFAYRKYKKTPAGRAQIDTLKLKVPIFGDLFHKTALARFAQTLSILLRSGVPILQALDIVAETVDNHVLSKAVVDVQSSVKEGESIARPLAKHAVFPPMVVQMLAVGEETGAIDTMLSKVGEFYDAEVKATVDSLTSLIEPLMIAVIGGCVGLAVIALYLPMFNVINLIK